MTISSYHFKHVKPFNVKFPTLPDQIGTGLAITGKTWLQAVNRKTETETEPVGFSVSG